MNCKTALGLAALIGSMNSGCTEPDIVPERECPFPLYLTEEMKQKVEKHQQEFRKTIPDPFGGIQYLKEGEYVLPKAVMEAHWTAERPYDQTAPWGIWRKNAFTSCSFQENLKKNLDLVRADQIEKVLSRIRFEKERGFKISKEELNVELDQIITKENEEVYLALSLIPNMIAYNEVVFYDDLFYTIMIHERTHKSMDNEITQTENRLLYEAYQDIKFKRCPLTQQGIEAAQNDMVPVKDIHRAQEKKEVCSIFPLLFPDCNNISVPFITRNSIPTLRSDALKYSEFYAYAISDYMPARVELLLERDHPETYKIFLRIREEAKPY
ncbi:MAG: hypothetical protein AABW48_02185 [Nanoarchaeota archaeon]